MSDDQRRILLARLLNSNGEESTIPAKGAQVLEGPLTAAQRGLWFLAQLDPGNPCYNVPLAWELTGPVDPDALAKAFGALTARHTALRTRFTRTAVDPLQTIHPPYDPLRCRDTRAEPDPRSAARAILAQDGRTPFDLAHGPILRATLVRTAEFEHLLGVTVHHIVFDNWSAGLLIRDLAELYTSAVEDRRPQLPQVAAQQIDVARHEQRGAADPVLQAQLSYWAHVLADSPAGVELPRLSVQDSSSSPRPAEGAVHVICVPDALIAAVRRQADGTAYTVLLAAWALLLHRYSRQTDLVIGSTSTGRDWLPAEEGIGYLQNTIALRLDLSGDPRFPALVARVRDTVLDARANQDVGFDEVVRAILRGRRDPDGSLFEVWFALSDEEPRPFALPGLDVRRVPFENATAKYPLSLLVERSESGWELCFEYATGCFSAQTVEALGRAFVRMLEELAAGHPRLSEVPLLDATQRAELLDTRGRGLRRLREQATVVDLFQAQVRRTPQRTALLSGGREISYAELNARANRFARRLASLGVGPDVPVALYVERGVEMAVAVLAVLKAGGCYCAIDPRNPVERIGAVLKEIGAPVLLTLQRLRSRLPVTDMPVWELDHPADLGFAHPTCPSQEAEDLGVQISPENLVYITYTSGSTGGPKGIAMPHRALVNLLLWQHEHYAYGQQHPHRPPPRTVQFASLAFDVSFQDMFSTWTAGGEVVLITEAERFELATLHRVLEAQRAERLFIPAPALHQVAAGYRESGTLPQTLHTVISGSEQFMATPDVMRLADADGTGRLRLHNEYGPSETHVVTCYDLPRHTGDWPASVPVGRPIANTRIYLLDDRLEPVPDGVVGEIYIGGSGVARGYVQRARTTAERFVADPFADRPGERMYRTGDLGRWHPSGDLEFLGRADFQVKIRGFRVELGEVEQILEQHPAVAETVAVLREDRPGDQRLIGYVTRRSVDDALPDQQLSAELRTLANRRLPDYMVPAAFVVLDALPLTPNGKIDRRALPHPQARAEIGLAPIAPRSRTEERILAIWTDVLGTPGIGAEDDFFRLGGHSLLATRVMARVCGEFGTEVPLRALFDHPTVAGLAGILDQTAQSVTRQAVEPIAAQPRPDRTPLSFAQQRLWFMDQLVPDNAFFNIAEAIRLSGPLNVEALRGALDGVTARHEVLRTRYPSEDGVPSQEIAEPAPVPLEVVDADDEQHAHRLVAARMNQSFDLVHGPVLRAGLISLGPAEHILWFSVHHIAFDGWSINLLLRELSALYTAQVQNRPHALAPLPLQYADFTLWHRAWMDGPVRERQLAYWREQLAGAPEALELPTDLPRPRRPSQRGAAITFSLESVVAAKLRKLAHDEGGTPFMVLLALFGTLLSRYGAGDDIPVATPIANRRRVESEPLIGLFFNTLVLRLDLSDEPDFRTVLRRTKAIALDAYEHQDLPFEQLVDELRPARDLSRHPMAQVMFQLLNTGRTTSDLDLPSVVATPFEGDHETTHLDLEWYLREADGTFTATVVYATDLFERDTVEHMAKDFALLAQAAVENPDTSLLGVPVTGPPPVAVAAMPPGPGVPPPAGPALAAGRGAAEAGSLVEVRTRLREIWATVLKVETVEDDDDFFDLGGQSLLATRLIARITDAFAVQLQLSELFERPTVAELAEAVDALTVGRST